MICKMLSRKLTNYSYFLCFFLFTDLPFTTNNSISPVILSEPLQINKPKGETAKFYCKVKHLGDRHLVWRRGYEVLATGHLVVSADPRISVEKHSGVNSLVIKHITEHDAGDYVCQISILNDILSVQHTLDVLVSPTVISVPPNGATTVKEGEDVTLQCEVTGNPIPTVIWSKKNGGLPQGAHHSCHKNSCLNIPAATKEDAGVFQCSADNGVGDPDQATLYLTVQYPPVIKVEAEKIHSGPGSRVVINCEVFGEPAPSIQWFFGEHQIRPSASTLIKQTQQLHSLVIIDTTVNSFGNYSCVAKNSLGTFKKYIEVHGRPTSAKFYGDKVRSGKTFFELSWEVESFVPILEYRLLYRRIEMKSGSKIQAEGSDWTNVIIPGDDKTYTEKQTMRWRLDNLFPDTTYECLVQARNKYGWSQASKMFSFTTVIQTVQSAATQGLNWTSSGNQLRWNLDMLSAIVLALVIFLAPHRAF